MELRQVQGLVGGGHVAGDGSGVAQVVLEHAGGNVWRPGVEELTARHCGVVGRGRGSRRRAGTVGHRRRGRFTVGAALWKEGVEAGDGRWLGMAGGCSTCKESSRRCSNEEGRRDRRSRPEPMKMESEAQSWR